MPDLLEQAELRMDGLLSDEHVLVPLSMSVSDELETELLELLELELELELEGLVGVSTNASSLSQSCSSI